MAFLWRWVQSAWDYLASFAGKTATIIFLGLDNAGKTTLLHMLRDNKLMQHMPTQKPTMEQLRLGSLTLQAHDLGGHALARKMWRDYGMHGHGLVFVVDASDRARLGEAAEELKTILTDTELPVIPLLILGNKIDVPGAMSEEELRYAFGLETGTTGKLPEDVALWFSSGIDVRPVEIFMCSIVRRQGFAEGFYWLAQFIS